MLKVKFLNITILIFFLFSFSVFSQEPSKRPQDKPPEDEIFKVLKEAGTTKDYPEDDVLVVFDRTKVDVEDTGLGHITQKRLLKVLTDSGAGKLATLKFNYDPATVFVQIKKILVYDKKGKAQEVTKKSFYDMPQAEAAIRWGGRMILVDLPRIDIEGGVYFELYKKGFQIAYLDDLSASNSAASGENSNNSTASETNKNASSAAAEDEKYIPPMRGHFYDVVLFGEEFPIKEKEYSVSTPKNKPLQYEIYNDEIYSKATFTDNSNNYTWRKEDLEAFEAEPNSPDESDLICKVVMTTVPSWEEKSRWFYQVNEPSFEYDQAIKDKVAEITHGLKTDAEKITALLHWSAQEIRYSGITMGKGEGYTLHPGPMIFNDRCGVCKDKAGMLVTLLRAAGYDSYAAMTMAGARVEEIPADQFNHCVVALRQQEDGQFLMLDPTWAEFERALFNKAEAEQQYVIGSAEGEGRSSRPYSPPEENFVKINHKAELDAQGNLSGIINIEAEGCWDTDLRGILAYRPALEVKPLLESWLWFISPTAQLKSYKLGNHRDFSVRMPVEIQYYVPKYAQVGEKKMLFHSPSWLFALGNWRFLDYKSNIEKEERKQDMLIWCTKQLFIKENIKLPKGYSIELPSEDEKVTHDIAFLDSKCSLEKGSTLVNNVEFQIKKRTIKPKDYPDFKEVIEKTKKIGKYWFVALAKEAS